jgi:hypothetical protein
MYNPSNIHGYTICSASLEIGVGTPTDKIIWKSLLDECIKALSYRTEKYFFGITKDKYELSEKELHQVPL